MENSRLPRSETRARFPVGIELPVDMLRLHESGRYVQEGALEYALEHVRAGRHTMRG